MVTYDRLLDEIAIAMALNLTVLANVVCAPYAVSPADSSSADVNTLFVICTVKSD